MGRSVVPAVAPPSTRTTVPVVNEASGEENHSTAAAISSGDPGRPSELRATAAWYSGGTGFTGLCTARNPGETAFTPIPAEASSTAHALVSISNAALDVQ